MVTILAVLISFIRFGDRGAEGVALDSARFAATVYEGRASAA